MSLDFKKSKIIAVALHPGWVKTGEFEILYISSPIVFEEFAFIVPTQMYLADMGGPKAPLTTEEATSGIVTLLKSLGTKHNGQFYQHDGKQLDW